MKRVSLLLVMILLAQMCLSQTDQAEKEKIAKRVQDAAEVLHEITSAPDKGIPQEVIKAAKCIVVIPHEIKGGFVVGARHGKGVATCRTPKGGWSAPEFISITGGSWGAQIGVEAVDNVLMIMNDKGVQRLLSNKFQIGADASAAAGPVGRHAEAGTDWKLDTEILSYSRAKGLFAGVTLNGAVVEPDKESIAAVYGKELSPRAILTGKVPPPPIAQPFLAEVKRAQREARAQSTAQQ